MCWLVHLLVFLGIFVKPNPYCWFLFVSSVYIFYYLSARLLILPSSVCFSCLVLILNAESLLLYEHDHMRYKSHVFWVVVFFTIISLISNMMLWVLVTYKHQLSYHLLPHISLLLKLDFLVSAASRSFGSSWCVFGLFLIYFLV